VESGELVFFGGANLQRMNVKERKFEIIVRFWLEL